MTPEQINKLLNHNSEGIDKAVRTLTNFQKKKFIPIKSGLDHLDEVCLGGLLPDLIIGFLSRPGMGKTFTVHTIRQAILRSEKQDISILLWNLEMPFFTLLLVELKKRLKKSYKEILYNQPTKEELPLFKEAAQDFRDPRLTIINIPPTPDEYYTITKAWIDSQILLGKEQLFILVDHTGIVKGINKTESIFLTLEQTNRLKLEYSGLLTFLMLGQLNRSIEDLWHGDKVNPINLRVNSSHIFGSDGYQQFMDVIVTQVIPQKANLEEYAAVNREKYSHLEEHFTDLTATGKFVRLQGQNRIYYDYIKKRLDDDTPSLYCGILNPDQEEYIKTVQEKDYTKEEILDF